MVEFKTEFSDNRQPRCACVLVLDTSGSMSGEPIAKLNAGLSNLQAELRSDPLALKRVEIAIVTFPPVKLLCPFLTAEAFDPPTLRAEGGTPLGEAVSYGLELVEQRKLEYRSHGIDYFRPWMFIVTDGAPDRGDKWEQAAEEATRAMRDRHVVVFAVGVPGADMAVLSRFSTKTAVSLKDLRFRDMFLWLTSSLRAVAGSASHTGANPSANVGFAGPGDWADIG